MLPMPWPLCTDDLVFKKDDETNIGAIVQASEEIDTYSTRPAKRDIIRHKDVSNQDFTSFLKNGFPPKGTVTVRWDNGPGIELIPESRLTLVDRALLVGDIVRRRAEDAMSGVVVSTFAGCVLKPVEDFVYETDRAHPHRHLKAIKQGAGLVPTQNSQYCPRLTGIPMAELELTDPLINEPLVLYKGWVGRAIGVAVMVTLKLLDNCVVEIEDHLARHPSGSTDYFQIGDLASTKKPALRLGKWIYGEYNPETPAVGTIVSTRAYSADIIWIQRRYGGSNEAPHENLEREELESDEFRIYNTTRRPPGFVGDKSSTLSNSELDFSIRMMRVRFKDQATASKKYDGSTKQGKFNRIDKKDTLGYDLNVFHVIHFTTEVTIQWQDSSITNERSVSLIPDRSIDDDHETWPGEIVHTLDLAPVADMVGVQQPGKVGIVQSVQASERMVTVKWCPNACFQYAIDAEDRDAPKTIISGVIGGVAADVEEEQLSQYDVEAPDQINVRRGDIALICREPADATGGQFDWVGEIVDIDLDGSLTVRLGAMDEVQDIKLYREDVMVVVRADGNEGEDEEEDGLGPMADDPVFRDMWLGRRSAIQEAREAFEDFMPEDTDVRYEDENGDPIDEEDVENDEWESDSDEDGSDVAMEDAPSEITTSLERSGKAEASTTTNFGGSDLSIKPDNYAVVEDDNRVPASHHFLKNETGSSISWTKRVQKEHKILSSEGALPTGVYVRSWDSRLDLLRVLIIGPADTPYVDAPFVIDLWLPPNFPSEPPQAHFHSWISDSGLGGFGRVNPNLYEDGKICLSILGTWEGSKGESWSPTESTLLQLIVSILGLVLVKEPYFNEPGYEHLAGLESSKRQSAVYNERILLRAKTFIISALQRTATDVPSGGVEGVVDAIRWLYKSPFGPKLLENTLDSVRKVLQKSEAGGELDGLTTISKGACISLRKILASLENLQ